MCRTCENNFGPAVCVSTYSFRLSAFFCALAYKNNMITEHFTVVYCTITQYTIQHIIWSLKFYFYLDVFISPILQQQLEFLEWNFLRPVFQPLLVSGICSIMCRFGTTLIPLPSWINWLQHPAFQFFGKNISLLTYK